MTATDEMCPAEQAKLRGQCTAFLAGHGPVSAASLLADIPGDTAVDRYGDGGVVAELEAEIAGLLDKPAAAFLPSGTMAQQSVLRVHADRRQRRTVIFHPMCHLHRHEGQAFQRLHGLTGRPAGDSDRLMSIDDLTAVAEPPAALLIELPQRDLGGQQAPAHGRGAGSVRVGLGAVDGNRRSPHPNRRPCRVAASAARAPRSWRIGFVHHRRLARDRPLAGHVRSRPLS